jgi:hypothetical protein
MSKKEIEFNFGIATRNTYSFQQRTSVKPSIGALYVKKAVFGSSESKNDKVTREWERCRQIKYY